MLLTINKESVSLDNWVGMNDVPNEGELILNAITSVTLLYCLNFFKYDAK